MWMICILHLDVPMKYNVDDEPWQVWGRTLLQLDKKMSLEDSSIRVFEIIYEIYVEIRYI